MPSAAAHANPGLATDIRFVVMMSPFDMARESWSLRARAIAHAKLRTQKSTDLRVPRGCYVNHKGV